jgi:hypothetical protein
MTLSRITAQEYNSDFAIPFDRLVVAGNIHLVLIPSEAQKLEILSDNVVEVLSFENKEGTLVLKAKSEVSNGEAVEAKLHYLTLSGLEISKGGRVQSADTLRASSLELDVLSGAKSELHIHVDTLDARVNQGSDIILYGVVTIQYINAYTWGNFLAYELESNETFVKAATGAQVMVSVSQLLEANATSKAFIGYRGDPEQKKIKSSVGGEISSQFP